MTTYKVVRIFQDHENLRQTIATGLTLEEAQAHCSDPNASSKSAISEEAKRRTKQFGHWLDVYYEE